MPERRPGLYFQLPEPKDPRPRFNPLIAAIPVVIVFVLAALPGNDPVSRAFGGGSEGSVRQALVARISQQLTAVPQNAQSQNGAPVQVATISPGGGTNAGSATTNRAPCEPVAGEPYCKYIVQPGDNLAALATRFNLNGGQVPGWELLWASNRPDLAGVDDVLAVGQTLRVPTEPGVLHTVFPGESLMALAVAYDVSSETIAEDNGLALDDTLLIGEVLLIASPPVIPETPVVSDDPAEEQETSDEQLEEAENAGEGTPTPDATQESQPGSGNENSEEPQSTNDPDEAEEDEEEEPEETPAPRQDDPRRMSWPVVQPLRITNYMSARHPLGMDFGLSHAAKSNIMAAADGTVVFAGGDPCCSYGLYVIVEHTNGLRTLYGHLSKLGVKKGQAVERGQALGVAGSTGYSTGVHLHFEVYLNGKRVNPMNYLPQ